ncbi:glycoside hydrolase family 18 protein [Neolentinus lepideus HHB14362 ss-1]|uniref:Glycoside hydrolase family 18 protein n=1 Tax=Neolentinus lepideus HHB14362 ss-1 TaxID=1314782 RepID=A0A165V3H1_9AGAM|nr:glycoside hydrolase family 18 protein [Neolentinus lepideus HHB14362 ss-1]
MKPLSKLCSLGVALLAASRIGGVASLASTSQVASTWWTSWHASDFPVSKLSWSKYNRVIYAFAETTSDVHTLDLGDSGKKLLTELVSAAHAHGVQVAVSVGGWTGSRYYSTAVASPANRTAFVKTVTTLATTYHLDGIDFDWEYPANQGIGCNTISRNDTSNFLAFLQLLRKDPIGKNLTLSAATGIGPFYNAKGEQSRNIKGFAEVLDYIEVMNYDIWGSWSESVGPNSPLNDTCAPPEDQQGSAVSAVQAWTAAGMPRNQIVLGVAAYGHSFRVAKSDAIVDGKMAAYPPFNASDPPTGDAWDDAAGTDECGNYNGPGGLIDFWGLMKFGYLTSKGDAAEGISYRYDGCTQTPYVYNATTEVMVAFDNAQSFAAKGKFIKSAGLGGFAMWEAGGDSDDILLNAVRSAAGYL